MSKPKENKKIIEEQIDTSYELELKGLISKEQLTPEELDKLEKIAKQVWKNHCEVNRLKYLHEDLKKEIENKSLEFEESYAGIKEKIGIFLSKIKPKSPAHSLLLKRVIAENYIIALQHLFKVFQERKIKSNLREEMKRRVVCETESPYYKIKSLLGKVQAIYDEIAVNFFSKNEYKNAHNHYFFLGEVIIKEIYCASLIKDNFLFSPIDIGFLYYNAGQAFLRCHNIIKDKYIIAHYSTPISTYLKSDIGKVFNTGNIAQSPEKLAILCFERAKDLLRKTGHRDYYLKCRGILYELKSLNNDFEFNISRIFLEICKNFVRNKNIVIEKTSRPKSIKEKDVRDYFMSHISLMIKEVAVAESTKTVGFSDLTIFGKDNLENTQEAIAEFKVWGRNSMGEHSTKNVLNQLRKYITDFESFGVIVMINPNKSSIKEKYIKEIIKKDRLYIKDSLEEPFSASSFVNLKSNHIMKKNKDKKLVVYHFILNISELFEK